MNINQRKLTRVEAKREGDKVQLVVILPSRMKGGYAELEPKEAMRLAREIEGAALAAFREI
ncbi:MAG: hypothetical protein M0R37_12025 [Bacteroidales bacterium]|jgi:hypothetical protein|nr:hypothetical protein [Sphaerochaeta sp.]MCK9629302.1 hypothetical protein [Bacteroidales bacterium]